MQPIKLLNIALLALLITLVMQVFLPKPAPLINPNSISLVAQSRSIHLPNIPQITVQNATTKPFIYNPCEDITLTANSESVQISSFYTKAQVPCSAVTVPAGSGSLLNLSPLHRFYASPKSVGGNIFTLKNATLANTPQISVEVTRPGFIISFLSALIYEPIYNLFVGILTLLPGHELGWAIIIVTIIIRLLLLVPQHKMLEGTRKMAELSPKIRAMQKEYAHDRATLGMKMMELYKKEGVNPLGSCLPVLFQIPIMLGLFWVISGISDPSNFYHLYPFFQDFNPTNIDTVFFGQDLLQAGGMLGIIMAVILGVTQWFQSYLSVRAQPVYEPPKPDEKSEMPALDPRVMQKLSLYLFPILIASSGYLFPLGLGLYWWIGIVFMIVQQYYVNSRAKKIAKK